MAPVQEWLPSAGGFNETLDKVRVAIFAPEVQIGRKVRTQANRHAAAHGTEQSRNAFRHCAVGCGVFVVAGHRDQIKPFSQMPCGPGGCLTRE